ncbi:hypothetical protein PG995_004150 [Apiospora arundinis]
MDSYERQARKAVTLAKRGENATAGRSSTTCHLLTDAAESVTFVVGWRCQKSADEAGPLVPPVTWYLVRLQKPSGEVIGVIEPVAFYQEEDVQDIARKVGLGTLEAFWPIPTGSHSVTYGLSLRNGPIGGHHHRRRMAVLQLRWHGGTCGDVLPLPTPYEVPFKSPQGIPMEAWSFVEGLSASEMRPPLLPREEISLSRQLALIYSRLWIQPSSLLLNLPEKQPIIGEINFQNTGTATRDGDHHRITIGPHGLHNLGGPFSSIRSYLASWLHHCLEALTCRTNKPDSNIRGGDLQTFVQDKLLSVPEEVEDIPLALVPIDMNPSNILLSRQNGDEGIRINGIIDWEMVYSLPVWVYLPVVAQSLFRSRPGVPSKLIDQDGEATRMIRDAFWDNIDTLWKRKIYSLGSIDFLNIYCLGLILAQYVN